MARGGARTGAGAPLKPGRARLDITLTPRSRTRLEEILTITGETASALVRRLIDAEYPRAAKRALREARIAQGVPVDGWLAE